MTQACLANTNFELPASEQDPNLEPPPPDSPSVIPASDSVQDPEPPPPDSPSVLPASDSEYEPEPEVRFEVMEKMAKTGAKKGSIHYSISLIIGCHTFKKFKMLDSTNSSELTSRNMLVGQLSPNFQDG